MSEPQEQDAKDQSFLDQTQLEGRATGEVKMNLDEALNDMAKILPDSELKKFGAKGDEWDSIRFAIYCHDCHDIVPAGMGRGHKGKMRTVCGTCNSRKISSGREEALRKFYNLGEKKEGEEASDSKKPAPKRPPRKFGPKDRKPRGPKPKGGNMKK